MRIQHFVLVTTLLATAACTTRSEPPAPGAERGAAQGAVELRQAATTATLEGARYGIETYLWRDFMPGPDVGAGGRPLLASVRVSTADGGAFPAAVTIDSLWVVNGDAVWGTPAREEQPRGGHGPATVEVMGRGGPAWGPDVRVDVVVRLRHAGGATALLRAPAQPIARTS